MAVSRPSRDAKGETWRVEMTNARSSPALLYIEHRSFGYYSLGEISARDGTGAGITVTPEVKESGRIFFPVSIPSNGKATLEFTLNFGF